MRSEENVAAGKGRLAATLRRPGGRRVVVLGALQIVLVWAIAFLLIWENHRTSVADWKRTGENMALSVTAYIGQAIRSADLVQKSVLDWIHEEDVESEAQFREFVGRQQFHEAMRGRTVGIPQIGVI